MDISTVLIGLAALVVFFLLRNWIDVYVLLPIQARIEMRRLNEDIKGGGAHRIHEFALDVVALGWGGEVLFQAIFCFA